MGPDKWENNKVASSHTMSTGILQVDGDERTSWDLEKVDIREADVTPAD